MGSIEHTGTMRAVQGAAIGLLAAVLRIGVVAYVHSGDQGTEQELADNSVLGSAVSSIKDTFSQLALGRIHITHKRRRYKSKGAALFDKPGPSKAPVAAECPDGDVYCAKLMDMRAKLPSTCILWTASRRMASTFSCQWRLVRPSLLSTPLTTTRSTSAEAPRRRRSSRARRFQACVNFLTSCMLSPRFDTRVKATILQ